MENKISITDKLLCMACLCVGRTLQEIADEKTKKYYLDALNEIPLGDTLTICPSVCWECAAMLRKLLSFREQVKDSYRILQTYMHENLHECLLTDVSRPPRLKVHANEPVDINPNDDHKKCDDDQTCDQTRDVQMVFVKNEVKCEFEKDMLSISEDEFPNRLSDYVGSIKGETEIEKVSVCLDIKKRSKDRVKRKKKHKAEAKIKKIVKSKKKVSKTKAAQKIITIDLSYEDMLLEREKESLKESYMKSEYKCESCLIGFGYDKAYKSHISSKHSHELGDYSCPICKTIISSVESFAAHYKRHTRRYECSICNKRTADLKVMQRHYYATHEIALKEYTCHLCGKISNSIDAHRYHKDTHKARVECTDCDKTFSHRAGLMNHRLAVHELHNAFPCSVCGKVFKWKTSLKRHMENHQMKDKPGAAAFCTPCNVSFASVSSYQRHMKNSLKHVTQEQLRFICDHCERRFADKTKLRDHIEEKHLHRTYQCSICLKPSKNRVNLDQHIRNVHKGRPNNKMCHHCGKGFPTKVQLESHIRTHTGERPFICEFCPTTFSQQSNLYKHNRQVHLNVKSKRLPSCNKDKKDGNQTNTPAVEVPNQQAIYLIGF